MSDKEGALKMQSSGRWAVCRPGLKPVEITSGDPFRVEIDGKLCLTRMEYRHFERGGEYYSVDVWIDEHKRWNERDLSAKRYVYVWADGIHLQARLEDDAQCILVIIGATPEGKKELIGFIDGTRESAHDWRSLLLDLKRRGLAIAPELAVADGALGFWKALGEVWPKTREQRCWVHKTANVLDQAAEEPAAEGQARAAGNLDGRNQGRRRAGVRRLHRELHAQIREGGRLPEQGSGHATGVLRLPGRALETPADDQSH